MFFFFSSRRRHTRYWRDWSSDVCSSDLRLGPRVAGLEQELAVAETAARAELEAVRGWRKRTQDRKSGVEGKSVDLGGRRIIKKKKKQQRVASSRTLINQSCKLSRIVLPD